MRLFDAQAHMSWRSASDYSALARAGVEALVEAACWHGQPRTHAGSFEDYFGGLLAWEPRRAARWGVRHYCALGLNAKEANDERLSEGVLWLLPKLLEKGNVLAVGEVGYYEFSPAEDQAFAIQAELARRQGLPLIVRAPAWQKRRAVERSLALLGEARVPERLVVLSRLDENSLPLVLDSGCWAELSLHRAEGDASSAIATLARRFSAERLLVASAADWDDSDILAVPLAARAMAAAGLDEGAVSRLLWDNPVSFFGQSGRLPLGGIVEEGVCAP